MALQARISALEANVRALNDRMDSLMKPSGTEQPKAAVNPYGPRTMCPKCGEKPAYFLHVKHCKGAKQA